MQGKGNVTDQQSCSDRFLAEIEEELLQRHGLIVNADYKVAQLWQEKLDVLVGKLAQLIAQNKVDSYMIGVAAAALAKKKNSQSRIRRMIHLSVPKNASL
jgi:hypothetical protein